jgi:hypothetical protein
MERCRRPALDPIWDQAGGDQVDGGLPEWFRTGGGGGSGRGTGIGGGGSVTGGGRDGSGGGTGGVPGGGTGCGPWTRIALSLAGVGSPVKTNGRLRRR